ncbi:MAG: hypothetical protein QHI38_06105 [Armatimonadota bacterium]|nr:hypothetical protein [Armatimonadota bacterium]
MGSVCNRTEERLWEHIRTGSDLPDVVRSHLMSCPRCSTAFREAQILVPFLQEVGQVTSAPDCRAAVVSQILQMDHRRGFLRWVYAAVACVVAGIVLAVSVNESVNELKQKRNVPSAASTSSTLHVGKPSVAETKTKQLPAAPYIAFRSDSSASAVREPSHPLRKTSVRPRKTILRVRLPAKTQPQLSVDKAPPDISPVDAAQSEVEVQPMAAVYATWETEEAHEEPSIYVYVEQDTLTGDTTTCYGRMSADRIEIYVESKPDLPEERKTRGCLTIGSSSDA